MATGHSWRQNLLWVDGGAGFVSGSYSLLLHKPLAELYHLPERLMWAIGAIGLLYAAYSLTLANRKRRTMPWIVLLVTANTAWACFCAFLLAWYGPTASGFGRAHLALESIVVGGLAWIEWRNRQVLVIGER